MYGINFPVAWLNQGAALVIVYTDGTILVSHGGTEMGQGQTFRPDTNPPTLESRLMPPPPGINTKLMQISNPSPSSRAQH